MPDEPSRAPQGAEGGSTGASVPFYRDVRVLAVITQFVFLAIVLLVIGWLLNNLITNSETRGISTSLDWSASRISCIRKRVMEESSTISTRTGLGVWRLLIACVTAKIPA